MEERRPTGAHEKHVKKNSTWKKIAGKLSGKPETANQNSPRQPSHQGNPPHEETRTHGPDLGDLQRVGPDKAVGYLSRSYIEKGGHYKAEEIVTEARESGLYAVLIDGSHLPGECVFIADGAALQSVFDRHPGVFGSFTPNPDEYIELLANTTVPGKTEMFDTVADTFADTTNQLRTDVKSKQTNRFVKYQNRKGVTTRLQTEVDIYLHSLRMRRELEDLVNAPDSKSESDALGRPDEVRQARKNNGSEEGDDTFHTYEKATDFMEKFDGTRQVGLQEQSEVARDLNAYVNEKIERIREFDPSAVEDHGGTKVVRFGVALQDGSNIRIIAAQYSDPQDPSAEPTVSIASIHEVGVLQDKEQSTYYQNNTGTVLRQDVSRILPEEVPDSKPADLSSEGIQEMVREAEEQHEYDKVLKAREVAAGHNQQPISRAEMQRLMRFIDNSKLQRGQEEIIDLEGEGRFDPALLKEQDIRRALELAREELDKEEWDIDPGSEEDGTPAILDRDPKQPGSPAAGTKEPEQAEGRDAKTKGKNDGTDVPRLSDEEHHQLDNKEQVILRSFIEKIYVEKELSSIPELGNRSADQSLTTQEIDEILGEADRNPDTDTAEANIKGLTAEKEPVALPVQQSKPDKQPEPSVDTGEKQLEQPNSGPATIFSRQEQQPVVESHTAPESKVNPSDKPEVPHQDKKELEQGPVTSEAPAPQEEPEQIVPSPEEHNAPKHGEPPNPTPEPEQDLDSQGDAASKAFEDHETNGNDHGRIELPEPPQQEPPDITPQPSSTPDLTPDKDIAQE